MDVYFGNTVGVYEQIDECICSRVSHYCHTPSWVNRVLCVQEPSDVPLLVSFGDFPLASFSLCFHGYLLLFRGLEIMLRKRDSSEFCCCKRMLRKREIGGNPVVVKKQGEGVDRQIIIK